MIGIIGGTGLYDPDFIKGQENVEVETEFGDSKVHLGKVGTKRVAFISRHGPRHNIPPHKVNYRKNIHALKLAGVDRIISINSVGSLDELISPGTVLVPHDFIDFTKGRVSTFYDDEVVHVDMSEPYCLEMRKNLIVCSKKHYDLVYKEGIYACTEGPRFEAPSEVKMIRKLGGDVVGMVGFPEVALAREAGLCYASICTIVNYGSGISDNNISIKDLKSVVLENISLMEKTIKCTIERIPQKKGCRCSEFINEARI
jgi:5'-methylthioadenosine phosphorylase